MESDMRRAIVAEALTWERTPFHDDARLKGIGVDCAQFVAGVYLAAGTVPDFEVPHYSSQWFLHSGDERLMNFVIAVGGHEIQESQAGPGDLLLYRLGHAFAHAAIIVDWPSQIIHAHKLSGMVLRASPFEADLRGRRVKFFSIWGR